MAWVGNFVEQGDHAQFFQQRRVERHFIQPVKDVARRAWNRGALDRIDLHQNRVVRLAIPNQGRHR